MVNQNNILDILKTSPSVALLKARSSGIIIDFLTRVYGDVAAVAHENIHSLAISSMQIHMKKRRPNISESGRIAVF